MVRTLAGPGLVALLLACGRNPAFDEQTPDATTPALGTSTGAPIDPTTGGSTDTTTTTGAVLDASTGTTGTTGTASTTSDATTDTGAQTTTDATTGFPEPEQPEHLQFYDTNNCSTPLWCHQQDQPPSVGVPQRTASQLCFRPNTDPPYLLDRIGWVVAANFGDLNKGCFLEVFSGSEAGPDEKLWDLELDAGGITVQPHAFVFGDSPLAIHTPIFCVGLVGGYTGGGGAGLGIGVDPTQQADNRSYINFSDGGICELPGWNDVNDINPIPTGTWCIDVDIRGN